MMTIDNIKEYIACINGGSGVIFQPADVQFTYILTAKHIFDGQDGNPFTDKIKIHYYDKEKNQMQLYPDFELVQNENYFPHSIDDVDIAIVKIQRLPTDDKLLVTDTYMSENIGYYLGGYPNMRRNADNPEIRIDEGIVIKPKNIANRIEASLGKNQTYEELVGTSGGGIFKLSGSYILLAGIQSQVPNRDEALGAIEFTPIESFNEIVTTANCALESIISAYLKSFSFLTNDSFNIHSVLKSANVVSEITVILKKQTQNVIASDFTPNCIKEYLGHALMLLNGQDPKATLQRPLWLAWLEVLTILNITKQKIYGKADFEDMFKSIRCFYSQTEKDFFVVHLEDLAKSDYRGLKKGGLVIVASERPAVKGEHILNLKDIPEDISRVMKREHAINNISNTVDIDSASEFPLEKFRFANISAFKEGPISDDYTQFENITVEEIIPKLKLLYEQLIK
jgi:hypothetical protein